MFEIFLALEKWYKKLDYKNKLYLNIAFLILTLIITLYSLKSHPILKLLAILIDIIPILSLNKLIKNKPKNHE